MSQTQPEPDDSAPIPLPSRRQHGESLADGRAGTPRHAYAHRRLWTFSNTRESNCSRGRRPDARREGRQRRRRPRSRPPSEIGYPCVVKAQVQIGGRGKAGGIKVAKDGDEAEARTPRPSSAWTSTAPAARGPSRVHQVWIEGASEIDVRVLRLDHPRPLREEGRWRCSRRMGGMNVEEIAEKDPDALVQRPHRPRQGLRPSTAAKQLAVDAGVDEDVVDEGRRDPGRSSTTASASSTRR